MIAWHSLDKQMQQSWQVSEGVRCQTKCGNTEPCSPVNNTHQVDGVETPVWLCDGVCAHTDSYMQLFTPHTPWSKLQVIAEQSGDLLTPDEQAIILLLFDPINASYLMTETVKPAFIRHSHFLYIVLCCFLHLAPQTYKEFRRHELFGFSLCFTKI